MKALDLPDATIDQTRSAKAEILSSPKKQKSLADLDVNRTCLKKKKGPFDPCKQVEKLRSGSDFGIFPQIVFETEMDKLNTRQRLEVMGVVYRDYFDDAMNSIIYQALRQVPSEGSIEMVRVKEAGPVIRAAYSLSFRYQEIFDFIVCTSLLAYKVNGCDIIANPTLYYESPTAGFSFLMELRNRFDTLRKLINKKGKVPIWVKDCRILLGQKELTNWLDSQIGGIENNLRRFGEVKRVGSPYYLHDHSPGYV
jgi:hypothetical protein